MDPSFSTRALQNLGGRAFGQRKYQDALELYSQALQLATDAREAAVLSSNIAAVLLKLDRPAESLQYARASTQVNPRWVKGFYRQAVALQALQQHTAASEALQQALALTQLSTPEAAELSSKLAATTTAAQHQQQHEAAQRGLLAAHTAWVNIRAREAHTRSGLTQQLQQGMAGYAWEPEDWEWRPTWTPSMRAAAAAAATTEPHAHSRTSDSTTQDSRREPGVPPSTALALKPASPSDRAAQVAAAGARLLSSLEVPPGSTKEQQAQIKQLLMQLTVNLAELEAPQRGLRLLQDAPLLNWYSQNVQAAIAAAAAQRGRAPTVLVLANGGGGLLGMFAAAAGAGRVVVVEKGRWGCRASRQLLEANTAAHKELVDRVELVPGPLSSCCFELACDNSAVSAEDAAKASSSCPATGRYRLTQQADVVVTDLLDFSVLGQGVVGALQSAAAADLLCPDGVVVVPHTVTVKGQLVNSLMTQHGSGFDLSPVNRYKWHPTIEHIQYDRYRALVPASPHITLQELDLASLTTPSQADAAGSGSTSSTTLYPGCSADALVVWCELTASHSAVSTGPPAPSNPNAATPATHGAVTYSTGMGLGLYYLDASLPTAAAGPATGEEARQVLLTTRHSPAAVRLVFDISQAACPASSAGADSDSSQAAGVGSTAGDAHGKAGAAVSESSAAASNSSPAVSGSSAAGMSAPSLLPRISWHPHGSPRHAWLPRWHFDMLADTTRNEAYEVSLRRAIAQLRNKQQPSGEAGGAGGRSATGSSVHVLDLGAGTGLLSMLAVRCGADKATAVEAVRHMADTASNVLSLNGLANITVVHKDARYLDSSDVPAAADLLVFEVFDCGCIGEGALHIVAAVRKHLKPGARILPAAAQVYCQPIQYGAHIEQRTRLPFDATPLAPYAWQPDYFEADLRSPATIHGTQPDAHAPARPGPSSWTPLAAPQPVFAVDFNTPDPATAFQPAQQALSFDITSPGVFNAVAFWFELALDETTTLSSSPYVTRTAGPSTTWKQAVQLLPEQSVQPGQALDLLATHDTYALSFSLPEPTAPAQHSSSAGSTHRAIGQEAGGNGQAPGPPDTCNTPTPTGVPLFDPAWRAAYSQLSALQSQLAKAVAQDPLEHRRVAAAALQLAMTPWLAGAEVADEAGGQQQQQQRQRGHMVVADPAHTAAVLTRLMA